MKTALVIAVLLTGLAEATTPDAVVDEVARSQGWSVQTDGVGCGFVTQSLPKSTVVVASAVFTSSLLPAAAENSLEKYRVGKMLTVKPVGYWKTNPLGHERLFLDSRTPQFLYSYTFSGLFHSSDKDPKTLICVLMMFKPR